MKGLTKYPRIKPTVDHLDEFCVKYGSAFLRDVRHTIIQCVNDIVKPHKQTDKNYVYDSWGCPIAMRCYASKRWIPFEGPKSCKFGKRSKSKSGFDRMTVQARKVWEFEAKLFADKENELKEKVLNGELTRDEFFTEKAKALDKRNEAFKGWSEGFATVEECVEYLKNEKLLV